MCLWISASRSSGCSRSVSPCDQAIVATSSAINAETSRILENAGYTVPLDRSESVTWLARECAAARNISSVTFRVPLTMAPSPKLPPLLPAPTYVTLQLITPLRVRRDGDYIKDPAKLDARSLLMTLVRRISLLCYFHSEYPLETDFAALKEIALKTRIDTDQLALERVERGYSWNWVTT